MQVTAFKSIGILGLISGILFTCLNLIAGHTHEAGVFSLLSVIIALLTLIGIRVFTETK